MMRQGPPTQPRPPAQRGPGTRGIVTYNFDEMLELAMTNRRCSIEVFFSKDGVPQNVLIGDIQGDYPFPIFHAHGYVPMKREPVKPPTWDIRPDVVLFNHAP